MKQADEASIRRLDIYSLRNMAREMGVKSPTVLKKEELIQQILSIMAGESVPEFPKSRQGRPPKNKSKIVISTEDLDLYNELDDVQNYNTAESQNAGWFFCDDGPDTSSYNEKYDYRDGEGYIKEISDRQYLFALDNCAEPRKAILVPKTIELAYPFRAGDVVKCLYKNSETYGYKIVNKIKNEEDILKPRPNYDSLGRVKLTKTMKIFSQEVKIGSKNVFKTDNLLGYREKVCELKTQLKDFCFVNLVLDSLVEDSFPNMETLRTFSGDSTKRNCFAVELAIDRVKRLVEMGENVVLCINDLLKVVKYQNFSLGYDYGAIKSNSFSTALNLFRLAGAYENGASVTVVAIMKNDKLTRCGDYLLNELGDLNVGVYEKY